MGRKDPRVDAFIKKSAGFARPILTHLRRVVHAGCPGVEETLKWGFPHFVYKGILCSMASFKEHCAFGFWKQSLLAEMKPIRDASGDDAMGQFGRITSLSDLPDEKTLIRLVSEAAALNDRGVKVPRKPRPKKPPALRVPDYFMSALRGNRKALAIFEGFNYSRKKDYVEWVAEARRDETRASRIETAVAWMADGKERNWKYARRGTR